LVVAAVEEVAALRPCVVEHLLATMVQLVVVRLVKVDKVVPNSRVALVEHHGQVHLRVARQVL
jgi:hypothetical protein